MCVGTKPTADGCCFPPGAAEKKETLAQSVAAADGGISPTLLPLYRHPRRCPPSHRRLPVRRRRKRNC